jgi:MauM/NapG family ferredoxin protein
VSISRRDFVKQSGAIGATVAASAYFAGWTQPSSAVPLNVLRPPGAGDEDHFAATCIRCQRCVDACPNHALVPLAADTGRGLAGTPAMRPRTAACMLCMDDDGEYLKCTEACPSGALNLIEKTQEAIREQVHIGVAELDLGLCYSYNNWSCGACFRACPLAGEAMTIGNWERPTIHAEHCVGCGCCERACIRYPHAIRVKGVPQS